MLCDHLDTMFPLSNDIPCAVGNSLIEDAENIVCVTEETYREKRIQHSPSDVEELIRALGGLNLIRDYWIRIAERVVSEDRTERYEGTKQFRMMLSVSGEIPIQEVIDTGVVPKLVQFVGDTGDAALQFEAAWALTNIASGTSAQTEVVVQAGAIPQFIQLLTHNREDHREQGMWGLGNMAGDRSEYRDRILNSSGGIALFVNSCRRSRKASTIRTGVWSLSNLCRGKPRPDFLSVAAVIPYLSWVLSSSQDSDTLSDACWALDGLSEHSDGVTAVIQQGIVPLLCQLLAHSDCVVKRPALRVVGQTASGTAEQTQEVIDSGVIGPLKLLLSSSKKSIRKDTCWTLSNIAAGAPHQLQALLESGVIPRLVEVFQTDSELEVKKEAAWAISNACTAQTEEHLEYLVSNGCVQPVCEMLSIDDTKAPRREPISHLLAWRVISSQILEVALEALDNMLQFGERARERHAQPINLCAEFVRQCEGFSRLHQLHHVAQGYGSYVVWQKARKLLDKWGALTSTGEKWWQ